LKVPDNTNAPWRDKETLYQKYVVERKTTYEIADELGCSQNCIMRWKDRFDIERDYPWREEETLRELYVEERLTTYEIAERLGCAATTVGEWLKKHGIPRRHQLPHFKTNECGYEVVRHQHKHNVTKVYIHRLTALANGVIDPSEFGDSKINIHHKNGIRWDNRVENLEKMSHSDHARHHGIERGGLNG